MSIACKASSVSLAAPANRLRTISHTLDERVCERLRFFAFKHRLSESSVIEHALLHFLASGPDEQLAWTLRAAGYGLRRRTG